MVNGVINIKKEKGYTSHDVVAKLRGMIGQRKIGHTGTLDPDATGVLPVCLGKATKLCDMLTDKDKTYEAILLLGKETDTQDIWGNVLEEKETTNLNEEDVRQAILSFVGEYEQIPPMYSALKVNGKKLYELAREGITVERKSRMVHIYQITILDIQLPRVRMEISCSKGTYIRTLCHDIGQVLKCGGCMEELTRTKVSRFLLKDSFTLEQIAMLQQEGKLNEIVVPIDEMFSDYKAVCLKEAYDSVAYNGNYLKLKFLCGTETLEDGMYVRVYDSKKVFVAIYQYKKIGNTLKIIKMFYERGK